MVLDSIYRVRVKGMLEYDPTVVFNTERLIYFRQQGRGEK
jgi:hypothetical protein